MRTNVEQHRTNLVLQPFVESIGDAQLTRFKADPANKGRLMDQGLWSWTRHPNYFGDSVVWWGLWLIALQVQPGWATVLSPAAMAFFLVYRFFPNRESAQAGNRPPVCSIMGL